MLKIYVSDRRHPKTSVTMLESSQLARKIFAKCHFAEPLQYCTELQSAVRMTLSEFTLIALTTHFGVS